MSERDVFPVHTWNFLQGDRDVEGILRDLPPHSTLVIRNQWRHVLATLAGIHDLPAVGWFEGGFRGTLKVPRNALVLPGLDLQPISRDTFWQQVLLPAYGIRVENFKASPEKDVLLVLHATAEWSSTLAFERLLTQLRQHRGLIVFVLQPGHILAPHIPLNQLPEWTALYYSGLNALLSSTLEEILFEYQPNAITVVGANDLHVSYSAIGATDYLISQETEALTPEACWQVGQRVTVLSSAVHWLKGEMMTRQEHIMQHIQVDLQAQNILSDQRFNATSENIAIDILQA